MPKKKTEVVDVVEVIQEQPESEPVTLTSAEELADATMAYAAEYFANASVPARVKTPKAGRDRRGKRVAK